VSEPPRDRVQRWLLRVVGAVGLAIFAGFFAVTFAVPQWVEEFATEYLEGEVIEQVDTSIDAAGPPRGEDMLSRAAAKLYQRNEQEILRLKTDLKIRSRELLDLALVAVRDPACECRLRIAHALKEFDATQLAALLADNTRLSTHIQQKYLGLTADLKREIRIFTATNAVCFLLLLLVAFAKPRAVRHLLYPGVLLLLSTLLCAWLYLFSQNWLLVIIHGDYTGFAYAAYLGLVFLFVSDIGLNRGRVTAHIVNGAASVLGSTLALAPC
jgi:hypothetical protein